MIDRLWFFPLYSWGYYGSRRSHSLCNRWVGRLGLTPIHLTLNPPVFPMYLQPTKPPSTTLLLVLLVHSSDWSKDHGHSQVTHHHPHFLCLIKCYPLKVGITQFSTIRGYTRPHSEMHTGKAQRNRLRNNSRFHLPSVIRKKRKIKLCVCQCPQKP